MSALISLGRAGGWLSAVRHKITFHLACDACNGQVDKPLYDIRKGQKNGYQWVYCNAVCRAAGYHLRYGGKRDICARCGGENRRRYGRYCSPACQRRRRKAAKWTSCLVCRVKFLIRTERGYCSRQCASRAHSIRMTGSTNSNFRVLSRYSALFKLMRPFVLQRDGFQCVSCGRPDEIVCKKKPRSILQIHHINENPRDSRVANLITLCRGCHKTHHHGHLPLSPQLSAMAISRNASMTSKWRADIASLLKAYSFTIAA